MIHQKYLRVTMPDGSRWDVPCIVIAASKATYYSKKEGNYGNYDIEFQKAYSDNSEIEDWAVNSMNWDEVKSMAKRVLDKEPTPAEYLEGWINGEKVIVEY